jgi:hypothetical protein
MPGAAYYAEIERRALIDTPDIHTPHSNSMTIRTGVAPIPVRTTRFWRRLLLLPAVPSDAFASSSRWLRKT